MTRLLTLSPAPITKRPNTDILRQPIDARQRTAMTRTVQRRKRRINYAKKIMNDDFIFSV